MPAKQTGSDFSSIIEEFKAGYNRSEGTLNGYISKITKYLDWCEENGIKWDNVTPEEFKLYFDYLLTHISPTSMNGYWYAVKYFYGVMKDNGRVEENIVEKWDKSRSKNEKRNLAYNNRQKHLNGKRKEKWRLDEVDILLANCKKFSKANYMRIFIDIGVNSGIRQKGIGLLHLDKIEHDEHRDRFYIQLTREYDKMSEADTKVSSHKVPIEAALVERIKKYIAERNARFRLKGIQIPKELEGRVFLSNTGEPIEGAAMASTFMAYVWRLCDNGLLDRESIEKRNVTQHCLRRTYAYFLLDVKGFELHKVSKLLGHNDIMTTMRYLNLAETEVLDYYDKKAKKSSLDVLDEIEKRKNKSVSQLKEAEINARLEEIDREAISLITARLAGNGEQAQIRLKQLFKERDQLQAQVLPSKEQAYLEEIERLKARILDLEREMGYYDEKIKETRVYKVYEKKTKKKLRQEMIEKARQMREEENLGWGTIADAINDEYGTTFTRSAIRYWLNPSQWQK